MATIEKLIKAFEALKVFQPGGNTSDDSKKKDQTVSKKDKMINCNIVADCICAPNMRAIIDFPKFLGIAMETFLNLCDDAESDVRMVADECINRSIKVLLETNLGRLQVELYKEIKKNGSSRTLRAALWRFAEMAPLIRPQKCRPYMVNMLPCLARICKREEEAVQETLLSSMVKICPALMVFANESEIKVLLKSFLPNLKSPSASCRRTAATSLVLICQYSRSPTSFYNYLLNVLLDMVLPVDGDQDLHTLMGVVLCMRSLVPHLGEASLSEQGMKGSFGVMTKEKTESVSKEQLIKVIQMLLHLMTHRDHNVVTSALEAFQQLLRNPTPLLVSILTVPGTITRTLVYLADQASSPSNDSLQEVPSFSKLAEESGLEDDTDIPDPLADPAGESSSDSSSFVYNTFVARGEEPGAVGGSDGTSPVDTQVIVTTTDSEYSGIEIGDLNEDKSEKSNMTQVCSSSQETLLSIQSISPTRKPSLQKGVSQDLNGNPEIEDVFVEGDRSLLPSPGEDVSACIGSIIDKQPAIVYCIRFIASRFLLSGCRRVLKPDKTVRVSVKSLALTCVSSAVAMYPQLFLLNLFTDVTQDLDQEIQDVLLYANHPDPQLKGNTTQIAANLIMAALKESRGNFIKWLSDSPGKVTDLSVQSLVDIILDIVEDSSSVAVRLAIISLQTCISPLLQSVHSELALLILLKLMEVKDNPYWLVKTELLELLSDISFKILVHLELCCTVAQKGQHHYLGKLNLQHRVIHNVVIPLLGNEDHRVRHSAAQTLVKLIPQLFYSADHCQQDPVIAVAKDHTGNLLTPDHSPDSPPLVQGLVKPFHLGADHVTNIHVESNLSRVIMALLHELNLSNVKHNTYGCCHALCLLSECFPATQYAHSWGCGPPTPLVPRDSTNRMVMRRPPSRSLSGSSTFSLDEMLGGSGGGPLTIMLSLLTSSLVSLDLSAHHDTLKLAGNLVSGAAYKCLRNIESYNNTTDNSEDTKWQGIADRVLFPLIEQFLTHIARLLNACCHVIDEQLPGPPQIKPSLPSLPTAPSLSPIKRKAKGEKDGNAPGTPGSSEKSTPKQQKDKDKEPERERNKKDGLGTFYSLPQYMKLYEVLRGAYSTYKISLDLGSSDKFCVLLKCALECLAQVLEIASLQDIGKYADELLGYLRTTVSLEPTCTILCVQQLLKALFGTNLVSQWEPQQATNISHKPGKATRMSSNSRPGLYSHCFTQPYSHFTQSLAAATFKANAQTEQEEATSMLNWLKKCVERKLPAILKPGSKTDKAAIAAYIRLFEPLVIKALKQYTVTSCLELQRQVLDLLSQLIQLRVNYCLLDSDQVFIGFIIKQIEFIEEGQIRNSESLIPNLFNFLVMLSYEKYHSKSIIGMPKIIQLCDGIMASGLHPTSHAIPALKPIVYDLFLLRAANKSDISRELETQREVVVSMLLRLIHYHETLDLLVIVLQQCHKESEERWKKLSRQVTDTILPSLARQQVTIDSMAALETLHRLFESLAPIVFRPVDILLKTLLQEPADVTTVENLQRWVSLVLSVLRVLMAQSKEEVILSRMQELGLGLNVFKVPSREMTTEERDLALALAPEGVIAWFLIQVIGNCASFISQKCELTGHSSSSSSSTLFLTQQLSHLLLYVTHMFQSGLFRKVATSAMKSSHLDTPHCYHSIQQLNHMFLSVSMTLPTLTLQWCNILILLNFDDQSLWSTVMQTPKRFLKPGSSQSCDLEVQASPMTHCCNLEILRRGGLVLFCDYVCENLTEAEHMTWLVINHVSDIISLSQESPVQDFVSAIHRNSSASSLFIQAIHARCENVSKPSLVRKTMKCLEAIHLSQTGSLLTLLIDKFLNTHHLAVARICDSIACKRVEMLLADSVQDAFKQLPLEDLDKLLKYMETNKLIKRHARLVSLLQKLRVEIEPEGVADLIREKPHPLSVPENLSDIQINKECYVSIVKNQCFSVNCNPRACAKLLHHLTYADVLSITMTKEFNLCILPECILLGAHHTLLKNNDSSDILDTEGNKIPQEPVFDPLLQAAQLTLIRHINNIINMLPTPHQIVKYGSDSKTAKRTRYLEKMDDFFSDTSWSDMVFNLVSSLNIYIQTLSTFPWQPEVPAESHCDIVQFCVLCAEMVDWMFHHDLLPTCERLHSCLHCMSLILQHPQLSVVIGQKQHTSWMCSLTGTAYQTVYSLLVVPGEKLVSTPAPGDHSKETLNDLIIRACDQVSELVEFSQQHLSGGSQIIPSFLQQNLRNIITGLGRQPVLNSYARTPSIVWKMGWIPSPNGEPKTKLPPLPVDFLEDKDVLREYIFRINSLGWINRQQFEETWMSLLSVVNPVTMPSNGEEMVVSPEEEMERAQCTVMAVRAITSLLIQSTLIPVPGNTSYSSYEIRPRDKPLGFLHTRCGKKLTVIRGVIEQEVHNLHSRRSVRSGSTSDEKDLLRYMFDSNLEREIMADDYTLGQIAIEAIWSVVGALDFHVAESDTTDSLESPTTDSPDTPGRPRQQFPLLSFERERRERSVNLSGLDIHSCLQFLLELYGQWMLTNPRPPLMLKNEVVKSIVCLSDLFMEREQYDWMQEVLLDLYKTHPQEDEVLMQYLNVGICKAAAVVGMDNSTTEKLMKIIDAGFRSPHLPSRIGALHGTLYLLEAGIQDVTKLLVPLATDFLLRNLSTVSQTCITSQNYMLTMWSTAFYIMENYHIDLKDLEFPSKVLQLAVITASGSEDSVSTAVYLAILKGLERLLLTDVLSKQDAEAIIKLGVDRLCLPSPQRSLAALGLMFTCMYSGKQYDQYSPSPREVEPGTTAYDFEVVYQDPESLILAMERVTVLFDRIKKGYPYEARVISRVLPTFLADFFPPQDVMNKVIGEFISSQQPYPQVVAKVVFQVFANLHQQKQQTLVRDWVMLSLSNFTQRTPIAMAMWSLTCFFISASVNPWLRALFTHVIGRMGRMDVVDRRLFCITAMDFYDQLTDDGQRRAFTSTFMAVSQPGSVYQELLQHINSLSKS